jgi:hypothetical protein
MNVPTRDLLVRDELWIRTAVAAAGQSRGQPEPIGLPVAVVVHKNDVETKLVARLEAEGG